MPSTSEVTWIAVLFNVVLLLLFISASTPATAMYINPPAVNPCKNGITFYHNSKSKPSMNTFLHQLFSPRCKMIALDLDPRAKPTARAVIRFLF